MDLTIGYMVSPSDLFIIYHLVTLSLANVFMKSLSPYPVINEPKRDSSDAKPEPCQNGSFPVL